jgi:hypothetical protein
VPGPPTSGHFVSAPRQCFFVGLSDLPSLTFLTVCLHLVAYRPLQPIWTASPPMSPEEQSLPPLSRHAFYPSCACSSLNSSLFFWLSCACQGTFPGSLNGRVAPPLPADVLHPARVVLSGSFWSSLLSSYPEVSANRTPPLFTSLESLPPKRRGHLVPGQPRSAARRTLPPTSCGRDCLRCSLGG